MRVLPVRNLSRRFYSSFEEYHSPAAPCGTCLQSETEKESKLPELNVGIIGAGGIASKFHLPEMARVDGARVTHLAGRNLGRLQKLAAHFDVPNVTQDYAALLADPSVDAVIVAAPHTAHVPLGLAALAAGKHLLMQKPLCASMDEADAFLEAAERSDRTVMCLPHFGHEVYACRELIAQGKIGKLSGANCRVSHGGPEVYYAEVRDFFGEAEAGLWFFEKGEAAVGALFDMGVYAVASLVAMLGAAKSVTGMIATADKPTELEDTATLVIQFANGAIGTAETGWCDPAKTSQWRIHGTRGKITLDGAGLTQWEPGSYTREDTPAIARRIDGESHGRGSAHDHWIRCIRENRPPELSSVRMARHVTEILLAGLESARSGQRIAVHSAL